MLLECLHNRPEPIPWPVDYSNVPISLSISLIEQPNITTGTSELRHQIRTRPQQEVNFSALIKAENYFGYHVFTTVIGDVCRGGVGWGGVGGNLPFKNGYMLFQDESRGFV